MDFLPELNQCFPSEHMLQYWPTASHCERVVKGFTLHFLCNNTAVQVGFASNLDNLIFFFCLMTVQQQPWSFMTQSTYICTNLSCSFILGDQCFFPALFVVLKVQRPLSGRSLSIFILASQSTTCFFAAFCCLSAWLLSISCPTAACLCAMLVAEVKSVKQHAMTGWAQSHLLLSLCSRLSYVRVNK